MVRPKYAVNNSTGADGSDCCPINTQPRHLPGGTESE
jgi:hypothetical protein